MNLCDIPASITLAQGLLETGAGQSKLARLHKNHFGIKCAGKWEGKSTYLSDDRANECFRKYTTWQESYQDHSRFLQRHRRYRSLFNLERTDYRSWANGLVLAGYATSPSYGKRLIKLIEDYQLHRFDEGLLPAWMEGYLERNIDADYIPRSLYKSCGLRYTLARKGDTFTSIAEELALSAKDLARYNELELAYPLKEGAVVYLEDKNIFAPEKYEWHEVEAGESMYSIAQRYGMMLKSLYVLNNKSKDYLPTVGDRLKLRE